MLVMRVHASVLGSGGGGVTVKVSYNPNWCMNSHNIKRTQIWSLFLHKSILNPRCLSPRNVVNLYNMLALNINSNLLFDVVTKRTTECLKYPVQHSEKYVLHFRVTVGKYCSVDFRDFTKKTLWYFNFVARNVRW